MTQHMSHDSLICDVPHLGRLCPLPKVLDNTIGRLIHIGHVPIRPIIPARPCDAVIAQFLGDGLREMCKRVFFYGLLTAGKLLA